MKCSNCGKCCEETNMELSEADIRTLEKLGYRSKDFVIMRNGLSCIRNVNGWCYFYNLSEKKCGVYRSRPLGCRFYPVVYMEGRGPVVDKLCPMGHTISKKEFKRKAKVLKKLLGTLKEEYLLHQRLQRLISDVKPEDRHGWKHGKRQQVF